MPEPIKRLLLIASAALAVVAPAIGGWLKWGDWPPGFGVYPPQLPCVPDGAGGCIPTPGFSLVYFAVLACAALVVVVFLLFPQIFGFTPPEEPIEPTQQAPLPWWFWVGLIVNLASWGAMWFSAAWFVKYLFTFLWWGFILVVDGVVYKRTNGASMLARMPKEVAALAVTSVIGWFFFEWLNYFVLENWYYPNSPSIFTEMEAYFWFSLTYTTVYPAIFEWYTLLNTSPTLRGRYANGPAIDPGVAGGIGLLLLGTVASVLVGVYPYLLFFLIWLGSLMTVPASMALLGYWTPFRSMGQGNWTPVVLVALASLCNGFFWEFWNFGSNYFVPGTNPNYWIYDVPFVNVIHIFSEMPLLGYFGYLPFGIQCWCWWLLTAHLLDLDPYWDPADIGSHEVAPR